MTLTVEAVDEAQEEGRQAISDLKADELMLTEGKNCITSANEDRPQVVSYTLLEDIQQHTTNER